MKNTLVGLLFFCLPSLAFAQTSSGLMNQQNLETIGGGHVNSVVLTKNKAYEGVRGTPMLSDTWNRGTVRFKDGKVHENLQLKLDLFANEVLLKRVSGDSILLTSQAIDDLTIYDQQTNEPVTFKNHALSSTKEYKPRSDFYQVLYEGKSGLYLKRKKSIIKASYTGAYNAGRAYDEFVDETTYYLKKADGSVVKVKITKASILGVLKDKQNEVKAFISKEKINFKNDTDVAKLLEYYDSL